MIIVETNRLRIRQFTEEDLDDVFRLDTDPEVMRYIGNGRVRSYEQVVSAMQRMRKYYSDHPGLGVWATELKSDNAFIGWCALKHLDNTPEIEVGYRLMRKCWGFGYATEAARALVGYGFEQLDLTEICGITHPDNVASGRVLEKAGLVYVKDAHFYESNVRYYLQVR